ncbi:FmdB family zinc ribbon protein, partial [Salmonella enterica]
MPTYSYRCTKCERVFDSFHSMSCTDPQYCPDCGAVGTKLLS